MACVILSIVRVSTTSITLGYVNVYGDAALEEALIPTGGTASAPLLSTLASSGPAPLFWEGGFNFLPYGLSVTTLLPSLIVGSLLVVVFLLQVFGHAIRGTVVFYLRAVVRMKRPVLILLGATPAAVVEFLTAVVALFST